MKNFIKTCFSTRPSVTLPPAELEYAIEELRIFQENIESACLFLKQQHPQTFLPSSSKTPLYLVIGASEAGKSTLLTQSGLNLIDAHRQNISNPSSTRYCHFWFSDKAIWVDTAGHYTTANPNNPSINLAWRGLIKLIDSYKNRCPLSGLIIAIDLADLARDPQKAQQILINIKQRIYEIARYVHELPMFLILTKVDLIAGFSDFFADLTGGTERQQAFGIGLQDLIGATRPIQVFADKFDLFMQKLQTRVFGRLQQETSLEKRGTIQDFPLQIERLKEVIEEIVNEIPHNAQTRLQGIYFTSAVQHGLAIDCLPLPFMETPNQEGKNITRNNAYLRGQQPYFVGQLFQHIINKNEGNKGKKNVSSPTPHYLSLLRTLLPLSVIIIGGFTLYGSYLSSLNSLTNLRNVTQQYASILTEGDSNTKLNQTYLLLQKTTKDFHNTWWQFSTSPNLNNLISSITKAYHSLLRSVFIPQLKAILEASLNAPIENQKPLDFYNALKAYLMLGNQDRRDITYLQKWFDSYWEKTYSNNKDLLLQQNLFLPAVLQNNLNIDTDERVINVARAALTNVALDQLIFALFADQSPLLKQHISTESSSIASFLSQEFSIAKLYTEPSVAETYNHLSSTASNTITHDWVLGLDQQGEQQNSLLADTKQLNRKIRSIYLTRYVVAWNDALNKVKITEFKDLKQTVNDLQCLTKQSSPLLGLLHLVKANTISPRNDAQFNDLVTAPFKNWQAIDEQKLQQILVNLVNYLTPLTNSLDHSQKSWGATKEAMEQNKLPNEIEALRSFAEKQPEPLRTWLVTLANNSWDILLQESKDYLNLTWEKTVTPKFITTLQNRYPLSKDSTSDVSFEDFTKFFGAHGVMDSFFASYLQPFVDTSKPYWVWKKIANHKIDISQETLEMFMRASLIRKMFYPNDIKHPISHFSLTPLEIAPEVKSFTLMMEGQTIFAMPSRMGSRWITWPGPKAENVALEFVDREGKNTQATFGGPWAWFKLLDKSSLQSTGDPRRYTLSFDLNGYSIKYQLVADKLVNPFIPDILANFRCVEKF